MCSLQCVLRERPRAGPGQRELDEPVPLHLPEGSRALFLAADQYGCVATVLPDAGRGVGRDGKRVANAESAGTYCIRVQVMHTAIVQDIAHCAP